MSIAYLLSGSNQGDRSGNLRKAVAYLRNLAGEITKCSAVFESPAWGFEHPSPFLNQALELKTELPPANMLRLILGIEKECGRMRSETGGYEARTLDIDILLFNDQVVETPELSIPHPRLHLRRFALLPLSEIAGEIHHPHLGKTISELLADCPDTSNVKRFEDCCCECCHGKEDLS